MAGKVADVLRTYPGVYDAIVIGMPDERLGEVPVALVEPYSGKRVDADALRQWSRNKLTSYEVPARVHVIEKLPRTVSDKVMKPAAKAMIAELDGK
jgi:acyl-coenzyme A synthetase/AMP-(fatty) acid ligase